MGKTKDIINTTEDHVVFQFKDDACGENGQFEPGANQVALKIDGMGVSCCKLSKHFFSQMPVNVPTHYVDADLIKGQMTCKKLTMLPLEFIWRSKAWGSFAKTYGVAAGTTLRNLNGYGLVEATMKNDALGDPRITLGSAARLGLCSPGQFERCEQLTSMTALIIEQRLAEHGYELIDIKFEFGCFGDNPEPILADEISGGIWRIVDRNGQIVNPIDAAERIYSRSL